MEMVVTWRRLAQAPGKATAIRVRALTFGSNVCVMRLRLRIPCLVQLSFLTITGLAEFGCSEPSENSNSNPVTTGTSTTTSGTTGGAGPTVTSSSGTSSSATSTTLTTGTSTTGSGGATSTSTATGG